MENSSTAKLRNFLCISLLLVSWAVQAQTSCVSQPPGLVNWWKGDGNANDSVGGHDGTKAGSVSYVGGEVNSAFAFINGSVNFGTNTANFGTGSFTVEFWLKTTAQVSENYQIALMEKRPACNATTGFWSLRMGGAGTGGKMHFDMASDGGQAAASLVATKMVNDGVWHHVAVTRSGGHVSMYLDGTLDSFTTNAATTYVSNFVGFVVGQSVCSCCDGTQVFSGYIDELSIYNRDLTASEILSIYNGGTFGKCGAPPVITQQPTSLTALTNSLVGFTVGATGNTPLSYQWSFNSSAISGATNSSFTISNVQLTNAGSYSVLVTNVFGSAQSADAILTVTTNSAGGGGGQTNCATISGLVNWWQGESSALDSMGSNNGTAFGNLSYSAGEVGQAFVFDGTTTAVDFGPNAGTVGTSNFTVEFWINTTAPVSDNYGMAVLEKRPECDYDASLWGFRLGGSGTGGAFRFEMTSDNIQDSQHLIGTKLVNDGHWHHVAMTRSGGTVSIYVDGTLDVQQTIATVANVNNTADLIAGQAICQCCDGTQPLTGALDEISIYNRALSAAEVLTVYNAGSYGKCGSGGGGTAPVITQQPVSLTAQAGSTVGFTVTATGTAPLSYQWNFNSSPISGATTSSLTINNVQPANAGSYSVLVTNAFGSATSANAVLTVTGGGGGPATNCATIPGLVNWYRGEGNAVDSVGTNNGTASSGISYVAGEVGECFSLNGSSSVVMDANAGNFRTNDFTVEFWMKTGSSQPAIIVGKRSVCDLGPAWNIMMGYINGTSSPGKIGFELLSSAGDYSATVTSVSINDNQWHHVALTRVGTNAAMYIDGTLAVTNTYYPSATIDLNNASPLEIGISPCRGPGGLEPYVGNLDELGIFSRALSVSEIQSIYLAGSGGKCGVNGAPTIFVQPTNIYTTVGSTVNLGVLASGAQPLGYNWIFNGATVYSTTSSPLVITNVQLTDAGTYYVVVTNVYGSATSSNAVLTVLPVPSCASVPGAIAWWPGQGDAGDVLGTNSGSVSGGLKFTNGVVDSAFAFNGTDSAVNFGTNVGNFGTNDFTVGFWVQSAATSEMAVMEKWPVCDSSFAFWTIRMGQSDPIGQTPGQIGLEIAADDHTDHAAVVTTNSYLNDGQWHHVAFVRAQEDLAVYIDGQFQNHIVTPIANLSNSVPFHMGQSVCQCCDGTSPFAGNLDEVTFYNRALTTNEILTLYAVGAGGKCQVAPFIAVQPSNASATVGSTVTIPAGAGGSPTMSYTWNFNGNNLPVITNASLVMTNVQLTNAGTYFVVVSNALGTATSSNLVLTVGAVPTATVQPTNQTALQYSSVTLSAIGGGSGPFTYQWQRSGVDIAEATNSTFSFDSVQTTDAGTYRVVIGNAFGVTTSPDSVLNVFVPTVRMENGNLTVGPVTVPLRMVAGGNENSVSVSVNFPATNLIYSSVALGSNAAGALLTVNTNQVASGKLGIAVFFADSSNFGTGTQELARITFRPGIVTNAVTNVLTFGDVPVGREVADTGFNSLVVSYSNAVVTMPVTDYEGDVSPRTNGNHTMSFADWTQTGRFVAGLDVVSNTLEFLRADCAPRTNGGDGRLSIADWVQAGRYAFGFDPIAAIGGATNFTVAETPKLPTRPVSAVLLSQNGLTNVVAVHLSAQGDENALGFSLSYDPAQLSFVSASLGSGASGAVLNVNSSRAASGTVGIAVAMATGGNFAAGDIEVVRVSFVSSGFGASYNAGIGFGDQPILREIADANATTETASYSGTSFSATGQPLPTLTAVLDSVTNIVLSWPAPSTGFSLESTTPLGTNWTSIVYTPATNGGNIVVTQAISADQVFYRLRHP